MEKGYDQAIVGKEISSKHKRHSAERNLRLFPEGVFLLCFIVNSAWLAHGSRFPGNSILDKLVYFI